MATRRRGDRRGNSYYRGDIARAERLAQAQLDYVDCGTSGGVWGWSEFGGHAERKQ